MTGPDKCAGCDFAKCLQAVEQFPSDETPRACTLPSGVRWQMVAAVADMAS